MVTFGSHVGNRQFQPFLSGVYAGVIYVILFIFHDFSPDSAAAGCCCQSAALWGLGAAPVQGAAAGCH